MAALSRPRRQHDRRGRPPVCRAATRAAAGWQTLSVAAESARNRLRSHPPPRWHRQTHARHHRQLASTPRSPPPLPPSLPPPSPPPVPPPSPPPPPSE
eukprot:5478892-Prymnesium_polylepis.1